MSNDLKPTEQCVFDYMRVYQRTHKRPPTLREISEVVPQLHWRSSARYVIAALLDKGYITLVAPTNYGRRYRAKED